MKLMAVDVFGCERNLAPVDAGERRVVDRTAIDHDLQARKELAAEAVIGHDRLHALDVGHVADREARYEPEQFGELACARRADRRLVDDGDRLRRLAGILAQPRGRKDSRKLGEKLVFGEFLRRRRAGRQQATEYADETG